MATWKQCVLGVLLLAAVIDASFPIHCPRDGKLEACVGDAMQKIIRRFRTGIPEVGFPSVDPLTFPKIEIKRKAGSVLNLDLTFTNLVVKDITINATVTSVKFHPEKFDMTIETNRPVAHFNGKYQVKGSLLWLPVWGTGTCSFVMRHIADKFHISGKGITKEDGKKHWDVTGFSASLRPRQMHLHFGNLYNGSGFLSTGAHALINSQWRLFYRSLKEYVDRAYSNSMKPHWRNFFLQRPFDEIFPDPK